MADVAKALACRDAQRLNMQTPLGFEGDLKHFQKKDIGYLYFIEKCLNANQTGLGKTIEIIGLNCLQKQRRELRGHIAVVPAQAILQWRDEYYKFAPCLTTRTALGDPIDRINQYMLPFDVLLLSYQILWRDWEIIMRCGYNSINFDEASIFKNPDSKTAGIVKTVAQQCRWIIPMSATPIQRTVTDLWSVLQPLNIEGILGSRAYFENRYLKREREKIYLPGHKKRTVEKTTGFKNLDELKSRISYIYVRRRVSDPDVEAELPELIGPEGEAPPKPVFIDLTPQQRDMYEDIRSNTIRGGYRGKELRNRFHAMMKVVAGTRSYDPNYPVDASAKADWIMDKLTGDLDEDSEKAVIFCWYKTTIYNFERRFKAAGINYFVFSSDMQDKEVRRQAQRTFFENRLLRVVIGTSALEMSLNLQAARWMMCNDMIPNPARMQQVIGRIRRLGSTHKTNVMCSLLANNTFEERLYHRVLQQQAVSDFVFDEANDVFEQLSDQELFSLIRG